MSDLLTVLVALVLLWGIGGLVALALLPQSLQRWWIVAGLSPLLTLGAAFSVSSLASVADFDVTAPITGLVVVGLAVIGALVRRRSISWRALTPTRSETMDLVALAAIAAVTLYALWTARGGALLLPNYDALNHASFVRSILEEATLDPSRIGLDPVTEPRSGGYYPLSMHLFTAFVVRFGSLSIPTALFGLTSIVVAVTWPIGMYALTKVTVPWRWAPVVAAAFASTAFQFPYKPISWGGLTTMVGLSFVPIVAALMLVALRDVDTVAVPAVGLALGALFTLHNSQMIAAAILAISIGARFVFRREALQFASPRVVGVFAFMFLIPTVTTLPDLVSGVQERNVLSVASYYGDIGGLVGQMVTLSMNSERSTILPLLFVLFGTAVAFATKSGRSVVLAYCVFATLVVVAGLDQWWTAPLHRLVSPWYGQYERVAYNLVIPVSILGAIAVTGGVQILIDRISGVRVEGLRRGLTVGLTVTAVTAVVATTVGSARNFNAAARKDFAYFQTLDISIVEEAQALALEEGRPIRILGTTESGVGWLYVLDPRLEVLGSAEYNELIGRLPQANTDPWVNDRLDRYGVDFIFTNGWGFNGAPSAPSETELEANPCFRVVAQVGDDRLWSVCESA